MRKRCLFCNKVKNDFTENSFVNVCDECYSELYEINFNKFIEKFRSCSVCLSSLMGEQHQVKHDCTQEDTYVCEHCNRIFDQLSGIQKHMQNRFTKYMCRRCKVSFCCNRDIKKHCSLNERCIPRIIIRLKEQKVVFRCLVCDVNLSSKQSLDEHMFIHYPKKRKYHCKRCKKSFNYAFRLRQHQRRHVDKFTCQYCSKVFNHLGNYNVHVNIHEKEQLFNCRVCSKSFNRKSNLTRHMNVHSKDKIKCKICSEVLSHNSSLVRHMQKHKKNISKVDKGSIDSDVEYEPKYKHACEVCEKLFKSSKILKRHLNNHEKSTQFTCKYCDKSFTFYSSLKQHLNVHEKKIKYECNVCLKVFDWARSLRRHATTHK